MSISLIITLYFFSYCLYIPKINQKIEYVNKKLSSEKIKQLKEKILRKEKVRKLKMSDNRNIYSLLRIQAMIALYEEFFYNSRIKNYKKLAMIDRFLWGYMSYLIYNNEEILEIYIYYELARSHPVLGGNAYKSKIITNTPPSITNALQQLILDSFPSLLRGNAYKRDIGVRDIGVR